MYLLFRFSLQHVSHSWIQVLTVDLKAVLLDVAYLFKIRYTLLPDILQSMTSAFRLTSYHPRRVVYQYIYGSDCYAAVLQSTEKMDGHLVTCIDI